MELSKGASLLSTNYYKTGPQPTNLSDERASRAWAWAGEKTSWIIMILGLSWYISTFSGLSVDWGEFDW